MWLAAGAVVFTGSADVVENPLKEISEIEGVDNPLLEKAFGANNADDNSCPNDNGPCAFPAENYNGGIVLGASFLDAANGGLTYFNPNTASGSAGDDTVSTDFLPPNAADRDQDTVDAITVGLDVDRVEDFFLYKTWKTGGSVPNHDNAYIFIQTDSATLDGPSPDNNAGCRESPYVKQHCDLVGKVNELSAGGLCFGGSSTGYSDTAAFFRETRLGDSAGSQQCDDLEDDDESEFPDAGCAVRNDIDCEDTGYWVEDPEEDRCQINQIAKLQTTVLIPTDVNIVGFCLSAADPEATFDFIISFDFSINTIEIDDLMIRSHKLVAEQGPDSGQNKVLELGEAGNPNENFYAEIRWGKGYDRATWPESNIRSSYDWLENEDNPGSPLSDQTRVSGLANPFPCRGNPTAEQQGWADSGGSTTENTRCVQDTDNEGDLKGGAYDDIYR
jgi:hypothetical protein